MKELGISDTRIRKAVNGAVIIEIPGNKSKESAEKLKAKLKQVFNKDEVQILRPEIKGDLRVIGFDESVLSQDIAHAIAVVANCDMDDLKVGAIRSMRNGFFMT